MSRATVNNNNDGMMMII